MTMPLRNSLIRRLESLVFGLFSILWATNVAGCVFEPEAKYGCPASQCGPRPGPDDSIVAKYGAPDPIDTLIAKYGAPQPVDTLIARYGIPQPVDTMIAKYGIPQPIDQPIARYGIPMPVDPITVRYGTPDAGSST